MCGRAANSLAPETIMGLVGVNEAQWVDKDKYQPSYNVTPGKFQPVLVVSSDGHQLVTMKWGLVPSWSDGSSEKPVNARCETLTSKPMFKKPVKSGRCIVFVEGYYEWTPVPKQAHYVKSATHKVMMLAALYDTWVNKQTGEVLRSYTIITVPSNLKLSWLHDRMPAILTEDQMETWLEAKDVQEAIATLRPFEGELEAYPVSNDVGKVANDAEYLTHKIEIKPTKDLRSFFFKKEGTTQLDSPILSPSKLPLKGDIRKFMKSEIKPLEAVELKPDLLSPTKRPLSVIHIIDDDSPVKKKLKLEDQ
eukprot:TRINITY_DN830_c0_g1_i1.p1 TRINITY_DN830_c0_g1~~TRINITY_DN830_c0_g1_i1.p1  ORF type:complete len:306 (-),score=46.65 TRINITY_DN830_c0_g1_i1:28-945(-)